MKIIVDSLYRHTLFKDIENHPENLGQELLDDLLKAYKSNQDAKGQTTSIFCPQLLGLLQRLKFHNEMHTFRYAKIDLLYWYEFQNCCVDILTTYSRYIDE